MLSSTFLFYSQDCYINTWIFVVLNQSLGSQDDDIPPLVQHHSGLTLWKQIILTHCKLGHKGGGKICATSLLKLCDIVAPLVLCLLHTSIRKPKLFGDKGIESLPQTLMF